jgi:hypothetical protein
MPRSFVNVLAVIGGLVLTWWMLCKVGEGIGSALSKAVPPGTTVALGVVTFGDGSQKPQTTTTAPADTTYSRGETAILSQMKQDRVVQDRRDYKQDADIRDLRTIIAPQSPAAARPCTNDCGGEWIPVPR